MYLTHNAVNISDKKITFRGIISPMSLSMSKSSSPHLSIDKLTSLVDDKLNINVSGLECNQAVTVCAVLQEDDKLFVASGQYIADDKGKVDLTTDWCLGGSYTGIYGGH